MEAYKPRPKAFLYSYITKRYAKLQPKKTKRQLTSTMRLHFATLVPPIFTGG